MMLVIPNPRASVLECASPLALFIRLPERQRTGALQNLTEFPRPFLKSDRPHFTRHAIL